MRVSSFWGLAGLVVVGVILADLVIHPAGTNTIASAGVTSEKAGLNALLGKTS